MTQPKIEYLDNHLAVLWKPAGLMVEPDRMGHPNLLEWLVGQLQKKKKWGPHPVHRLDRPTAGWVVFARSKAAFTQLSQQWENKTVTKIYRLLTHLLLPNESGNLRIYLFKNLLLKKAIVVTPDVPHAKLAISNYRLLRKYNHFLYEVVLQTGRYHQIRAQFSHLGAPIIGDDFYGSPVAFNENAIALCAGKLSFSHPTTKLPMSFEYWPIPFSIDERL